VSWINDGLWFGSWQGQEILHFSSVAVGPTKPLIQ